jgi:hypothetical protein
MTSEIIMPEEKNEGAVPSGEENAQDADSADNAAPRAKTPLERVREGQAKMRGTKAGAGTASNERQSAAANSYKRRIHQRRAG